MSRKFDPHKIKALALDLDGTTLLPGAVLGERTLTVLRKLISGGMQILLATGRAIESSEPYRSAIGAEGPMVFFNGAEVADVPSGRILSVVLVDVDIIDFGIDVARRLGVHYQIYLPAGISPDDGKIDPQRKWESLLIERPCPEADMYNRHTKISPIIVKDLKSVTALPGLKGCIKGMFIADPSLHDEIRRQMNERFGSRVNIIRSLQTFLELLNTGVSKGAGLKIAMKERGLSPEEVIAFGDEENDLSMFTEAGFSAAPSSARDNVREAADIVFGSNADEGLALYIEETFL
ncbi:MAG: Cof-type HAD-IIB family hydrolase [Treponema sp.]|jgi:Cof subfamily protein (haloacid dehalogenase superfamily)|nr:Cof-type HAD-IIB family hydrolase [Treponema sp.]